MDSKLLFYLQIAAVQSIATWKTWLQLAYAEGLLIYFTDNQWVL
jgi:hypothetical protein